ncbi:BnaA06g16010D [Brassica napus]|uniref:(rape) hypothetical protein n=1 Tax=Brassica napus TaxID=3708 RepID=A0A078F0Y6_BRANA|nr:unnamed protein product [Brassica napus]CDY08125.1 BnaA06g16010D [Brassica napus]
MEERAMYSLKQAVTEDPEDAVRWHQVGLHCLCSQQYKLSQKYLKPAAYLNVIYYKVSDNYVKEF